MLEAVKEKKKTKRWFMWWEGEKKDENVVEGDPGGVNDEWHSRGVVTG